MVFGLVGACTNGTSWGFSAQGGRVTIPLAVATLGTPAVCDILLELAFPVADNEVVKTNVSFLDISRKCHDDSGVCLVLSPFCWGQPSRSLNLYKLVVVYSDAVRDFW
jgi:hypothetical protein